MLPGKRPAGSSILQRLRARTRKMDQRQALRIAIDYVATRARIVAIEQKVLRRRRMRSGSAAPSST
jgi:hypothetical protein